MISSPGLSSETQENNDNNTNDDDFTDLNISSLPSQSTTSPAQWAVLTAKAKPNQTLEDLV